MISGKARKTATRYLGDKARDYDKNRAGQRKWEAEGRMVERALDGFPRGTKLLDVPCGTGRFIGWTAHLGFEYIGVDSSPDMIAQCREKLFGLRRVPGLSVRVGSIFALDLDDDSVDVSICIRFANLIKPPDLVLALGELQRVTRQRILINLRVGDNNPARYHDPHDIATVEGALLPGWSLVENQAIHEDTYRLLTLAKDR